MASKNAFREAEEVKSDPFNTWPFNTLYEELGNNHKALTLYILKYDSCDEEKDHMIGLHVALAVFLIEHHFYLNN